MALKRIDASAVKKKRVLQTGKRGPKKGEGQSRPRRTSAPARRKCAPMVPHDQKEFLKKLRHYGGLIARAAEHCGVPYNAVHLTREAYPDFAEQMDEAIEFATSDLEAEAIRRGCVGIQEPVFGSMGQGLGGGKIGERTVYSDTLLIFMLKARRPEVYRERYEVRNTATGSLAALSELAADAATPSE